MVGVQASGLEEAVGVLGEAKRDLDLAPVCDADVLGLVEVPEHVQRGGEVRGTGGLAEGADDADGVRDVRQGLAGHPHQLAAELEHFGSVDTVSLVPGLALFERLVLLVGVGDVRDRVGAADGELARRPVLAVDLSPRNSFPLSVFQVPILPYLRRSTHSRQYARRAEPISTWLLPRVKKSAFSLE